MENYRQKPNRKHTRQAIDGFLNTPNYKGRRLQSGRSNIGRQPVLNSHQSIGVQSRSNRTIGDFKAPEGYRSADPTGLGRIGTANPNSQSIQPQVGQIPSSSDHVRKQFDPGDIPKDKRATRGKIKHRKQKTSWKRWALRGSLVSVILIVAMAGFLSAKGYLKLNQIFKGGGAAAALDANVDPAKLRGEGDGRINIMMLGRGGVGHDGPDLTDTLLVASIDPVNKKAAIMSIPRDLFVESKQGDTKINAVFANAKNNALRKKGTTIETAEKAGLSAVENIVEDVTGVKMHYYVLVDFKGFEKAVNTVGGVTINVPEQLRDPTMAWENKRNPVLAEKGIQTMDGKKALMYVRSRHGTSRGDFDRAERQRAFLVALKSEILSSGTYGNPVKISKLMDDFGNHAQTDFSLNDIMRLHSISKGIADRSVTSIGLADPPNDYLTIGNYAGQSIVKPREGVFEYAEINKYIRSKLPDGYIVKERAPIIILNGTTSVGFATKESDELKSYSYNVVKADNAPSKSYPKTILVDLDGKNKYTKNYLEKRYKTKATSTLPQGITLTQQERKGFVIIIGSNETTNR